MAHSATSSLRLFKVKAPSGFHHHKTTFPSVFRQFVLPVDVESHSVVGYGKVGVRAAAAVAVETAETTELDIVSKFSEIVPDTILADDFDQYPPTAATVTFSFLLGLTNLASSEFKPALDSALAYGECYVSEGKDKMSCFLDKALINVGAQLAKKVTGRVSTEVDPRLTSDTNAIIQKVKHLVELYKEMEVSVDRLLFKIPASWQGIEAARQLEEEGIQTHITGVHSFAQAVACGQAKVSVVQVCVGRIRDWARSNSGDDEVDSALQQGADPGILLVERVGELINRQGHKTRVMASNVRTKEDVLALLGVDYIVAPLKVLNSLKSSPAGDQRKYSQKINLDSGDTNLFTSKEFEKWDQEKYEAELGPCARQLLHTELESAVSQLNRVEEHFSKIWPPPNM